VVVRPGVVADAAVDGLVRVARPLGAEFPDGPPVAVAGVEEGHEAVERVAVGTLRVGLGGARSVCLGLLVSDMYVGRIRGATNVAIMLDVT
jgi:hypothetical protein